MLPWIKRTVGSHQSFRIAEVDENRLFSSAEVVYILANFVEKCKPRIVAV